MALPRYPQTACRSVNVSHTDSIVGKRLQTARENTLSYLLDTLKKTGRYDAFDLKWHPSYSDKPLVEPIPNHLFWDSDVAKWIEAAAYLDPEKPAVAEAVKDLVRKIVAAQQEDGYVNIHYTVVDPEQRFTNIKDMHELYNLGHLIEAALAHKDAYDSDDLLNPLLKYVDLVNNTFGPASRTPGYPGHPEIELALLRMYEVTRSSSHLQLAQSFINERGREHDGHHFFDEEAKRRGDDPAKSQPAYYPRPRSYWYAQAHEPIVDQETIEGHAVRAVYLLTAVADLLRIQGAAIDARLREALFRLWHNMVEAKMTVTGGIGSTKQWEGFGPDYSLPQGTEDGAGGSYNETCASIGLMMLADRLLKLELDSQYADVMELAFYNTVLTSMSHDGTKFTYENQLASSDSHPSERAPFFVCACCPPNVCRCLGMIGGYAWDWATDDSVKSVTVIAHLYIQSDLTLDLAGGPVKISQTGDWPWSSDVSFRVDVPDDHAVNVKLRIPHYALGGFTIEPACPSATLSKGYLTIPAEWVFQNPVFTLRLPLQSRFVTQHPYVTPSTISLARGPIIYCAEDVDNSWVNDHFRSIMIDPTVARIDETEVCDPTTGDRFIGLALKGGISSINTGRLREPGLPLMDLESADAELSASKPLPQLNLVPYFFRANRGGQGHMRVGFRRMHQNSSVNGYH